MFKLRNLIIVILLLSIINSNSFYVNSKLDLKKFHSNPKIETKIYTLLNKYYKYSSNALSFLDKFLLFTKSCVDYFYNGSYSLSLLCNINRRFDINYAPELCLSHNNYLFEGITKIIFTSLYTMRYSIYENTSSDNEWINHLKTSLTLNYTYMWMYNILISIITIRKPAVSDNLVKTFYDTYNYYFNLLDQPESLSDENYVKANLAFSMYALFDWSGMEIWYFSKDQYMTIYSFLESKYYSFNKKSYFQIEIILFITYIFFAEGIINSEMLEYYNSENNVSFIDKIYFVLTKISGKGWNKIKISKDKEIKDYVRLVIISITFFGNFLFIKTIKFYEYYIYKYLFDYINTYNAILVLLIETGIASLILIGHDNNYSNLFYKSFYIMVSESTYVGSHLMNNINSTYLILFYILNFFSIPFWKVIIEDVIILIHKHFILKNYAFFRENGMYQLINTEIEYFSYLIIFYYGLSTTSKYHKKYNKISMNNDK